MEQTDFVPQNPLEESLVRAFHDPAHRAQFYRDLIEADVLVVQHGASPPAEEGPVVFREGDTLRISTMHSNGSDYVPFFSSLPRLQATLDSPVSYLRIGTRALFAMTQGADLLLNPGNAYGKEFVAGEVAAMLDGSIWQQGIESRTAQQDTQVLIGQPKQYPQALVDTLGGLFKQRSTVKRAWLAQFYQPGSVENAHTLIGIEASGDFAALVTEAGAVINGVPIPDPPVDFVQVSGSEGLGGYFIEENVAPFYRKRLFGLF